jgi:cytosine/adenosine deaminase-related metal-dependent hydrolase
MEPAKLIRNALAVVTMDDACTVIPSGDVLVRGRVISAVGRGIPVPGDEPVEIIDGRDKVVMPGLINTHHHLYQTLTRNLPRVQDSKLFDWLLDLYEVWRGLDSEAVATGARVGLAELLLTGCTTSTDHFYVFPKDQPGDLLDETIRAAAELGIRFHPTRGSMSRGRSKGGLPPDDVVQDEDTILRDCERVIDRWHDPSPLSMCRVGLAPCSPFSVTTELLAQTAEFARHRGVSLHTHLCETKDEEAFCRQCHGKRPLAYMASVGWLGPDVWYAHGIHFDDAELRVLAQTGTAVAHCPTSNMRLGSGVARVPEMRDLGVRVGLAVDGSASNDSSSMVREMIHCMLVNRVTWGVDRMPAYEVLRLATRGGADLLGRGDVLGSLEPGKAADIAMFDLSEVGFAGALGDPAGAILFCGTQGRAHTVLVNGEVVVREGRLARVREDEIRDAGNAAAARLLEKARVRTGIDYLAPRRA